ncbi:MAG: class II fructose-bisphosphate aldolase [Clostridia bacterium]|nr:class II fructose-bisphosphate aldolase [Clostridia bacterium]
MLVTLKQILKIAEAKKCAIGSFNTPNLESMKAVIGAAEELGQPVIIMHAQIHEEMNICKIEEIGKVMLVMADMATVPVCVHLDHCTDLSYLKRGLDTGFTSVMYDGSELPPRENYANTCVAVEMAARYGASVEAEVGSLGSREGGTGPKHESVYTDPEDAQKFVKATGIDALACAFGTAHGMYKEQPKLDFERVEKLYSMLSVPLVMHGGSGVSEDSYRRLIKGGIRKINYYSYMAKAGGIAAMVAGELGLSNYHDIAVHAERAMRENAMQAMKIFQEQ